MNIRFENVHIKNFMSIGDAHIVLDQCGFV